MTEGGSVVGNVPFLNRGNFFTCLAGKARFSAGPAQSKPARARAGFSGFTLVEVLVGLAVAGVLAAMLASIMGNSIFSSQELLKKSSEEHQKTVLRRIIHRDIKHMQWQTGLEPTSSGFRMVTGHNTLVSASIPMQVSWDFRDGKVIRIEENQDLEYSREQVLSHKLESLNIAFMSSQDQRWIEHQSWLMGTNRPYPRALRLRMVFGEEVGFEIVEHIPGHDH
ncbi:type II secretion system protein [Desulfonatronospira sp.]|uniref:PulJ/GspJ family protein n=1 Tax=Desulfonatronospira sp. TaxID=1962951 RepID=UPI0025BAD034|nr:type II secretion system protein [Desulfonatronospira sp.]